MWSVHRNALVLDQVGEEAATRIAKDLHWKRKRIRGKLERKHFSFELVRFSFLTCNTLIRPRHGYGCRTRRPVCHKQQQSTQLKMSLYLIEFSNLVYPIVEFQRDVKAGTDEGDFLQTS
jgi:hypothetical protein